DPVPDAALAAGPQRVSATFNEQLQTTAPCTVGSPADHRLPSGPTTVMAANVVCSCSLKVALTRCGPAGTYTVNYRVTSADGHVVSGSWSFRLTVPGTGTPGPPAAGPDGGGALPVWPFVAVAVALVAGGAWWAARRRR
ncbi:copper resistance CopC family protein, partial [Mycobacterium sp. 1165178.9]|uniref:copper resistance CopC family protein n=1 Tax=Mycobacterium sp. 1165178.9 TaxID=1834070 RepID=UPI0007FE4140